MHHFHNLKSFTFQSVLNAQRKGNSHMGTCLWSTGVSVLMECSVWPNTAAHIGPSAPVHRGAAKSLAWPGRKKANVSVRMVWISFSALPCRKDNLMTARVSMLLKSRASLICFRACFLPGWAKDLPAPQYCHNELSTCQTAIVLAKCTSVLSQWIVHTPDGHCFGQVHQRIVTMNCPHTRWPLPWPSAPVYCHNELSTHQMVTVLVIYNKLDLVDTLELLIKMLVYSLAFWSTLMVRKTF